MKDFDGCPVETPCDFAVKLDYYSSLFAQAMVTRYGDQLMLSKACEWALDYAETLIKAQQARKALRQEP